MKAKRLLSVVLAVMLVLSCVMGMSFASAEETSYNTYAQFEESIKPENNYGLTDTVNEGKILQAWNWSYENAIAMMPKVAEQGFTTMQISPPNEIKMPTKGVAVCAEPVDGIAPNGWWMFYQPAGFQLNESDDNALGTKAEFVKMCEEAKKYGIKILVDAVINHMGTDDDHVGKYENDSVDPMDHVNPRAAEFEPELLAAKAFHSPWKDMTYVENMGQAMRLYDATGKPIPKTDASGNIIYNAQGYPEYKTGGSATEKDIEESLTQHCTSGLPDLATETQLVQDTIYDYLVELIEAGADGFRFDAAKHIETVHDTYFPSDFWEDTLQKLRKNYPDVECFAYGEILNKCGDGRPFSEYTELMDVTDSSSFWGIKDAVCNNGNGGNATPKYPNANFTKENVIQWNESHDTYIDGGTSSFTVQQRNKIWALTAARQEITGVYFARPDDRTGTNRAAIEKICADIILGDANVTSWANPEVKAVNQFDNFFGAAEEFCRTKDKVTLIERFDRETFVAGATLVNLSGTTKTVSVTVRNLPAGNYIEAITGNTFTVADGVLTGQIGNTGIACLYYADDAQPEFPEIDTSVVTMEQLYEGMAKWDASSGTYPVVPGANTIVFSAKKDWTEAYVYAWMNGTEDNLGSWPGNKMTFALENEFGEYQYYTMIPVEYDCYIINNGKGAQTVDLEVTESTGMYMSTQSGGKYTIGTWAPNFEELTVSEFLGTPVTTPSTAPSTAPSSSEPSKDGLLGDVDGSGVVNVKDATAIQKVVADIEVINYDATVADVDASGSVNVKDATAIQKFCADIETGFPIGK
ncbi:MAG: starch-binding protein [Ruminococcus sp.]|nr:starch-binding protein [Ruminococcus sp.]